MQKEYSIFICRAAQDLGAKAMFDRKVPKFKQFLEEYRPANRLIIVRNPWARLVSAYEDKIVEQKWSLKVSCSFCKIDFVLNTSRYV